MTLPPQMPPNTPREPQPPRRPDRPERPEHPERPERPERPARRKAPPAGLQDGRRNLMRATSNMKRRWRDESANDKEVEAFIALTNLMSELAEGTITGQDMLDRLA